MYNKNGGKFTHNTPHATQLPVWTDEFLAAF